MSKQQYREEFKTKAVKQITERGHKVADLSAALSVSQDCLVSADQGTSDTPPG